MDQKYDDDEIFNRALTVFGSENRLNKFREECMEAAVEVDRLNNGRMDALNRLINEMADVSITLEHARKVIKIWTGFDAVGKAIDRKTQKLIKQVKERERLNAVDSQ